MKLNSRPCGTCLHLDARVSPRGQAYCWFHMVWRLPMGVVEQCKTAERADGGEPPGRIHFEGEQG